MLCLFKIVAIKKISKPHNICKTQASNAGHVTVMLTPKLLVEFYIWNSTIAINFLLIEHNELFMVSRICPEMNQLLMSLRLLQKKIILTLKTFKNQQIYREESNSKWARDEIFCFIFKKREVSYLTEGLSNIEEKEVEMLTAEKISSFRKYSCNSKWESVLCSFSLLYM